MVDTYLPRGGGPDGQSPLFVKKGTPVLYSVFAMHRRKDLYGDDADDYRPERWDGLRPGWGFLPFNGGPRICLGREYTLDPLSPLSLSPPLVFTQPVPSYCREREREWQTTSLNVH